MALRRVARANDRPHAGRPARRQHTGVGAAVSAGSSSRTLRAPLRGAERGGAQADRLQDEIAVEPGADGVGLGGLAVDRDQRQAVGARPAPARRLGRHDAEQLEARRRLGGLRRHRGDAAARRTAAPGRRARRPSRRPPPRTPAAAAGLAARRRAQNTAVAATSAQITNADSRANMRRLSWNASPAPGVRAVELARDDADGPQHSRRIRSRGFTLIELMVVLVIIGVLAALIVPNMLDRADDARVTAARTDVNNLMQALKLYKLDNLRYPSRRAGPAGAGRQADGRADPAELAALPRQAAERSVGAPVPVREPGAEGRDRRLQLRRRRRRRRRRQECGHRLLAVGARRSFAAATRARQRARLHADRADGGGRADRHRHARSPAWLCATLRRPSSSTRRRGWSRCSSRPAPRRAHPASPRAGSRSPEQSDGGGFRFVGLPPTEPLPTHWLEPAPSAQVIGATRRRARPRAADRRAAHRAPPARTSASPWPPTASARSSSPTAARRRSERASARGFTLIEVLVALAIVAITLGAGIKAAGALTNNTARLAEVTAAQWCADNQPHRAQARAPASPTSAIGDFSCDELGRTYPASSSSGRRRTRTFAASMPACWTTTARRSCSCRRSSGDR